MKLILPEQMFPVLSHKQNIEYCIKAIERTSLNNVIGYRHLNLFGVIDTDHELISYKKANRVYSKSPLFDYVTYKDLLDKQNNIKEGMYILHNGLIIGEKE